MRSVPVRCLRWEKRAWESSISTGKLIRLQQDPTSGFYQLFLRQRVVYTHVPSALVFIRYHRVPCCLGWRILSHEFLKFLFALMRPINPVDFAGYGLICLNVTDKVIPEIKDFLSFHTWNPFYVHACFPWNLNLLVFAVFFGSRLGFSNQ